MTANEVCPMHPEAVAVLRCPHGEPSLAREDGSLVCPAGHRFDLARQGYVNLLAGQPPAGVETAGMVAARASFQAAGHHAPLTEALGSAIGEPAVDGGAEILVDLGAGTGHHLAAAVDVSPGRVGVAVDLSKHAARRAARAHPRIGAVVADVWQRLPIRDASADAALVVFAPRNPAEICRILRPGGRLVVATPTPRHLAPLVAALDLLHVAPDKTAHLDEQLAEVATLVSRRELVWQRPLSRAEVTTAVAMGPSSWHREGSSIERDLAGLPEPVEVTFAVNVSVYERRD